MIYLDNAATTRPCPACVAAVGSMLTDHFANPSSLHGPGIEAMKEIINCKDIEKAKELIEKLKGVGNEKK